MDREFLTEKEFFEFKNWAATNGFSWDDLPDDNVVFTVIDGQYDMHITTTSDPELYEVYDDSERQTLKSLLKDFYSNRVFLFGVEVPKKKIEKFIPEEIKPFANHFDHFRIYQRPDKLWTLMGAVGYYLETLAICDYKLPLKTLGSNFAEIYWTMIYTTKKERKVIYDSNKELDRTY